MMLIEIPYGLSGTEVIVLPECPRRGDLLVAPFDGLTYEVARVLWAPGRPPRLEIQLLGAHAPLPARKEQ